MAKQSHISIGISADTVAEIDEDDLWVAATLYDALAAKRDRYREALEKVNEELIEIADATESSAMAEDIDNVRAYIKDRLASSREQA